MAEVEQSQEKQPAAAPQKTGDAWKWWMAGVLFLATVLTYLDRQTLAICEKMIREEFHLNDEQYGYLVSAFRWAYGLVQIPAGMMADHLPLRATFGLAVGLWSLAGASAAFVFRLPALMVTRAVLGMGETFNWPCASRIVANTFSPADRSLASGIFNSGAALGTVISPLLIGGIAAKYGWRGAFFAIGSLGAVWLVIWFAATTRRSPAHAAVRAKWDLSLSGAWILSASFLGIGIAAPAITILLGPEMLKPFSQAFTAAGEAWPALRWILVIVCASAALGTAVWSLLRFRARAAAFWMLIVVSMTVNPCWYFMNDWLIKSLREDRHLDNVEIGGMVGTLVILTIILLIADTGNLIGGGVIKLLVRRGWSLRAARGTVMLGAACAIAPVTIVSGVESVAGATVLIGLAGMGFTAIIAAHTACQQDLSFRRVGVMSGIVGTAANIAYAIASPKIGAYHDRTHSYQLMFVLVGTLPLIGAAAILVFDTIVHGRKAGAAGEPA